MYCGWPELGQCCFCLPLRKGVLIFGYASILFSAFMIGLYSYIIHYNVGNKERLPYREGRLFNFPSELCITIYCAEVIFDAFLIYGAHKKLLMLIKAYYYFALTTAIAVVALQITNLTIMEKFFGLALEVITFTFAGFCMQIYLITLVRSLMKKLEKSGPHVYDNQLHQIVTGEFKVETNDGVYNSTTAPADI